MRVTVRRVPQKHTADGRFAGTGKGAKVLEERTSSIERCWLGKPRPGARPRNNGWPSALFRLNAPLEVTGNGGPR